MKLFLAVLVKAFLLIVNALTIYSVVLYLPYGFTIVAICVLLIIVNDAILHFTDQYLS